MQRTISPAFYSMLEAKQAAVQPGVNMMITELNSLAERQPEPVAEAVYACTEIMGRKGSKHFRALAADAGYRAYGGDDPRTAALLGGVMEMIQTHLLVMDDIADNSDTRRGGAAAHRLTGDYLEKEGIGRAPEKLGIDTALTAGFIVHVHATSVLGELEIPGDHMRHASNIITKSLKLTGLGQLRDLTPDPKKPPTPDEVLETYRLKTGEYTGFMPPAAGAAAAGANHAQVEFFRPYVLAGVAFQLRDDILGVNGKNIGKPQNDVAEGKYTWPIVVAMERAKDRSLEFLKRSLGNAALTPREFAQCSMIMEQTGAIADAETLVKKLTQQAVDALDAAPPYLAAEEITFLQDLALHGAKRKK